MCKYDYYKHMGENQYILELPSFLNKYRQGSNKKTVCIDKCIVEHIKKLWSLEIHTLSSCCGHGNPYFSGPEIVLAEFYSQEEIEDIGRIIDRVDDKKWNLYQWRGDILKLVYSKRKNK